MLRAVTSIVLVSGFLMGSQVGAQELSEDRVKELVAEALRENPKLVLEALQALEQRQAEAEAKAALSALSAERSTLEQDSNAPVLGNPDGDVTVVEFFDYNCPYCKQAAPEIDALLEADKSVRLVLREWPILSEGSAIAAR
ncbi:MAG: thioredoxin domain-containing protein, partial [Polynucleobacter sp.]|nr:thioredoxin domain-containing protein [Polynucleobacter sp.]